MPTRAIAYGMAAVFADAVLLALTFPCTMRVATASFAEPTIHNPPRCVSPLPYVSRRCRSPPRRRERSSRLQCRATSTSTKTAQACRSCKRIARPVTRPTTFRCNRRWMRLTGPRRSRGRANRRRAYFRRRRGENRDVSRQRLRPNPGSVGSVDDRTGSAGTGQGLGLPAVGKGSAAAATHYLSAVATTAPRAQLRRFNIPALG